MYIHDLDPVLFDFGFLVIRWYSLAYIFGILIGWWLGKKIILKKFKNLNYSFKIDCYKSILQHPVLDVDVFARLVFGNL